MPLRIATAPGTWGVETPGDAANPPWQRVLNEVAAAGFAGVELGPVGYLPEAPRQLGAQLSRRGLTLAGGFVMVPFHDPGRREEILHIADRTCALLAPLGVRTVALIEAIGPSRALTAGRSADARRLGEREWASLVEAVTEVAGSVRRNYGLGAAFHPHAGTYVEFADEVERLMAQTDPELVGLCLDTGHTVYADGDPADWCRRWAERLRHVHLKDVRTPVLEGARAAGWGFERAVGSGVFGPLGAGGVDLAAVRDALAGIGYDGWATYEQDRTAATAGAALIDAAASLDHLRALGFAEDLARCG